MARRGGTLERTAPAPAPEDVEETAPADDDGGGDWTDDWTLWRCECGYGNVGTERCTRCHKRAPQEIVEGGGLGLREERTAPAPSKRAGSRAWKTVFATIGLNLLVQIIVGAIIFMGGHGLAASVRISLFTSLAYYTAIALWVLGRSVDLGLRPTTGRSTALVGAAEGFVVGAGGAVLLVAGFFVATGQPALDPTTAVLAAQSSIAQLVIGFLMIALLGPAAEELVFRGFLAEAFRKRGRRAAIWISAVGFSLAHLRLAQFRYYVAMGVVFGLVYWRRGLVGSIVAHAAFNGMLIVVAVAATHGPPLEVQRDDYTVTIPAAWHVTETPMGDLVALSPLGSEVELTHMEAAGIGDVALLARGLASGLTPMPPGARIDFASVVVVDFPSGPAVAMSVDVYGGDGRVVMIPRGDELWMATLRSGGEARDTTDFHEIVRSWRF